MLKALIGKKVGMTQVFNDDGGIVPVSILMAGPCTVVTKKTVEKDGYDAVQIGYGEIKSYKVNKPELGHFKKNNINPVKILKEFRILDDIASVNVGEVYNVSVFDGIKNVSVSGTSKGKGFQGVVKRWGFKGGKDTHGSNFHRAPGSIGQSSYPSKVFKGLHMPGHMGNDKISVLNLKVIKIDKDNNLLYVKGAVPGANGNIVYIYVANESGRKIVK
jgi:large subunit ribosomal protein L3